MPLYDFTCEAGHTTERLLSRDTETAQCECGKPSTRGAVYTIGVSGFARAPVGQREVRMGAFNEASAEIEYAHSRRTNVDGSRAPAPSLWKAAKAEATRLQKLGVKDSADLR